MCLNECKWFSSRSSHHYPIVNSCHVELPRSRSHVNKTWVDALSYWRNYYLMTRAPIPKVYSPQFSTICHLRPKSSEEQRFICVTVLLLGFSVLLYAGSVTHPLVIASHSDLFYILFLHSDGYIKWNVVIEIIQVSILVVILRNLKSVRKIFMLHS